MSFSTKSGQPIAIVRGGKANKEIIYINQLGNNDNIMTSTPTKSIEVHDGKFEQLPSPTIRILYIAGPSGSGKSTYASIYIKKYINLYIAPELKKYKQANLDKLTNYEGARFYLFSRVDQDKVLDELDPVRVKCDESIINNPFDIKEIEPNSILLFDDIDCITNKRVQAVVNSLKEQVMDEGRHRNIHCVITSHLINGKDKNTSRTTLNEMNSLTIFPQSGSHYQINYALKMYFGLSPTQIKKILATNSRWVTLIKNSPQVILSENSLSFIAK